MKKDLIFIFLLIIFQIPIVKADDCSDEMIAKYKSLSQNIHVDYVYVNDPSSIDSNLIIKQSKVISDDVYYITISGLEDGLVAIDQDYNEYRRSNGEEVSFYANAGDIKLGIYADTCSANVIRRFSLVLPKFNIYSKHEYCERLKEYQFDFCDEWYQGDLEMSSFLAKVEPYIAEIEAKENTSIMDSILEFLQGHLLIVGGVLFFLIVIVVILIHYRRKRSVLE